MDLIQILISIIIMLGGGLGITAILINYIDRNRCIREEHGHRCKGEYCDSCYTQLPNGMREYKNQANFKRDLEA